MRIRAMMNKLSGLVAGVVLASVMLLAAAGNAWAGDKIYLKDGRVIEGEIVREVSGSIWVNYAIGGVEQKNAFFGAGDIDHIERDAASAPPTSDPIKPAEIAGANKLPAKRPGEVRGVVMTLEGTVGVEFASQPLRDAIPWLEENQVDVVVLKVNSGGGYLSEIAKIHDVLINEYKPRFRTVAWIESAISAAAMSSHVLEEIYFMKDGNYGACTGWFGALQAVQGLDLEKVLYEMEKASAEGKKDPHIMRSMQIEEPLSYNEDKDGNITWYNTEEGEHLVNPAGRILTFDAVQAARCKFSKGTADNLDQLTKLLGYTEVNWLGKHEEGSIFPISKVEEDMRAWREAASAADTRLGEIQTKYDMAVANARASSDLKIRGSFVGVARRHLATMRRLVEQYPVLADNRKMLDQWFRDQEKMLRELLKP